MEVKCRLNGENIVLQGEPTVRLREVLYHTGCYSVRDSDDAEGFAGSDTIIFNGELKYANFIMLYQAEGAEIKTAESLLVNGELNYVQKAMVAAGIVQSAYNAPAAALILTWLLEKHPNPTRQQVKNVMTSIFIRDAGYEHYYLAVKLACELRDFGEFKTEIAPSFRPQLDIIGKPAGKIDGAISRRGWEAYAGGGGEDYFEPALTVLHNDGNPSTQLFYVSHRTEAVAGGVHTAVQLRDNQYPLEVVLHYVAYAKENVIKTWTEIVHHEKRPVVLSAYSSAMIYFNRNAYYLTEFSSDWAREAQMSSQQLQFGKKVIDTTLGSRAAMQTHPFFEVLEQY